MIFDHEIQQMRGLGFNGRIGGFAKDRLVEITQQRDQPFFTFLCE